MLRALAGKEERGGPRLSRWDESGGILPPRQSGLQFLKAGRHHGPAGWEHCPAAQQGVGKVRHTGRIAVQVGG
jgi:hypothetical protein